MKKIVLLSFFLSSIILSFGQPILELDSYVSGFNSPVDIANAGDERLFVVEQPGIIQIIDGQDNRVSMPFLDIRNRIASGGERGLLGLVFHPDYSTNGYFFVNYTNNSGNTVIARFSVQENNPNLANSSSEKIILQVNQPYSNHNAGDLAFGPDGYLYIPLGDGGSGGDPDNFSQNRLSLLGKMLRIDVNTGNPYAIPPDNPFALDDFTLDEIWAIGLRNPWRFSFDRLTGDIWIGDVGQNRWEEIDFQPANSPGGENYGWNCFEGDEEFAISSPECGNDTYIDPVFQYFSDDSGGNGCSVTGGFVYRGSAYPELYGQYLFTDFCSGQFWATQQNEDGSFSTQELGNFTNFEYSAFGEDQNGELYVAGLASGTIYRVTELCSAFTTDTLTIEQIGNLLSVPEGFETYQWSRDGEAIEGATDRSLEATISGEYTVAVTNELGCSKLSKSLTVVLTALSELRLADLQIHPNPFEDNFRLDLTPLKAADFQIEIRNVLGQLVKVQQQFIDSTWRTTIDLSKLTAGVYFITIRSANKELSRRLVKE